MLLIEFTINAVLNRLSQEGIDLTNYWNAKVQSFSPPQLALPKPYGGYCSMRFGKISFFPDLFDSDWPPPINGVITVKYTSTTQEAAETLFTGIAHLVEINREEITYDIFGPKYDETIASATAYNDTLDNVIDTILTGIAEIDTVDTTYARAVSPNVTYTTSGTQLAIDLASEIAAFYTHLFYISGTTAYLVDMLLDNGSRTITEFDFFPSQYPYLGPIAVARAGDFSRNSAYVYGKELTVQQYHATEANVNTCLDNILAVWHKPQARLRVPFIGSIPSPGEKISWTDTAQGQDTDMWIRARNIQHNFDEEEIVIEGEGAIAAA